MRLEKVEITKDLSDCTSEVLDTFIKEVSIELLPL